MLSSCPSEVDMEIDKRYIEIHVAACLSQTSVRYVKKLYYIFSSETLLHEV